MKIKPVCFPCAMNFALRTMKFVGEENNTELMIKVARGIASIKPDKTPAHMGTIISRIIRVETGKNDPYLEEKRRENEIALQVYPLLKEYVRNSHDPLGAALKVSALGNAIDLGVSGEIHLDFEKLEEELHFEFKKDEKEIFRERLKEAESLLLIADNAGEIIFDRVLLEEITGLKRMVAVKSGPVINDITIKDVYGTGIENIAEIVETGSDSLGIIMEEVSEDFRKIFYDVDIVIAKGHANTETLVDIDREVFFLLRAKCDYVAEYMGVKKYDFIFERGRKR
ncbi:hypothetical protein DRQ23_03010 [bacterium]|nr:MAG: hypothetical protein DRQ23_03010 [bacterium]